MLNSPNPAHAPGFSTTQTRPWTTDLSAIPAEGVLAAAVAGIPIVLLLGGALHEDTRTFQGDVFRIGAWWEHV